MKTHIIIEYGHFQLALEPENKLEKQVIDSIRDGAQTVTVTKGNVYLCNGGYYVHNKESDEGIIFRLDLEKD